MPKRDYDLSDEGMPPELLDAVEHAMVSLAHVNHVLLGEARARGNVPGAICGGMAFTLQVMGAIDAGDASPKNVKALAQADVDRALAAICKGRARHPTNERSREVP
jgi:hypothetical protein